MPDKRVLCLAMRAAFPKTLPILAAFLFLGITKMRRKAQSFRAGI